MASLEDRNHFWSVVAALLVLALLVGTPWPRIIRRWRPAAPAAVAPQPDTTVSATPVDPAASFVPSDSLWQAIEEQRGILYADGRSVYFVAAELHDSTAFQHDPRVQLGEFLAGRSAASAVLVEDEGLVRIDVLANADSLRRRIAWSHSTASCVETPMLPAQVPPAVSSAPNASANAPGLLLLQPGMFTRVPATFVDSTDARWPALGAEGLALVRAAEGISGGPHENVPFELLSILLFISDGVEHAAFKTRRVADNGNFVEHVVVVATRRDPNGRFSVLDGLPAQVATGEYEETYLGALVHAGRLFLVYDYDAVDGGGGGLRTRTAGGTWESVLSWYSGC